MRIPWNVLPWVLGVLVIAFFKPELMIWYLVGSVFALILKLQKGESNAN